MRASSSALSSQATLPHCNPPPTYASAAQPNPISNRSFGHGPKPQLDTPGACSSSTPQLLPSRTEETDKCAYRHSQGEVSSPGLEGDFVGFTTASFQGPVNPFQLNPNPRPPGFTLVPKTGSIKRLPEFLGDLHFSDGSPMKTDGTSPASLSIRERGSIHGTKGIAATGGYIDPTGAASSPRLTEVPERRPLSMNAAADCAVLRCELSPASPALDENGSNSRESTTLNASKHGISAFELPSGAGVLLRTPSLLLHGPNHRSDALVPSVPLPETVAQYQSLQPCSPGQAGDSLPRSRSVADLNRQSQYFKPQDLALIPRMRSQQQIMALLGSIET
jgi:hypothetical protein